MLGIAGTWEDLISTFLSELLHIDSPEVANQDLSSATVDKDAWWERDRDRDKQKGIPVISMIRVHIYNSFNCKKILTEYNLKKVSPVADL